MTPSSLWREFQREVASILTEFTPDQLAQQIFGTVSVLRKVTAERTMLSRQLALADQTTQDVTKGLVEIERLNKELVFVRDSLKRHIQKQDEDHEFHAGRHRADLQKYLAEEQANVRGLQVQVSTLQARLRAEDARRVCNGLACVRSWNTVGITPRFLPLGEPLFLSWLLPIRRYQLPPTYPCRVQMMMMMERAKMTAHPRGSFLDLTRDSETKPSGGGAKRKRSSKGTKKAREQISPDVPAEIQEYLSAWIRESADPCRPDGELLLRDVELAREMLKPFPVIWSSLRLDVRALILYGVNYEGALEWLGEDRSVHGCFHQGPLLEMLLRMMFWNELDDTPWTKYVPRRYFLHAPNWIRFWKTMNTPAFEGHSCPSLRVLWVAKPRLLNVTIPRIKIGPTILTMPKMMTTTMTIPWRNLRPNVLVLKQNDFPLLLRRLKILSNANINGKLVPP
ncbi:LOW QUALITY PROTEIN: hypothetical protein PHMEG_00035602 [Phytophthora megakarya]|uniref:Uncharacterized protein n=1 Tax=Phytophthora megakarya TaxID=4795 RepID=A0A225UPY3_9STRA|nr:LOW QUALITY PROTEIN: hypothetical protein PHMEG_00035602 [Phytophthora megakarya]